MAAIPGRRHVTTLASFPGGVRREGRSEDRIRGPHNPPRSVSFQGTGGSAVVMKGADVS